MPLRLLIVNPHLRQNKLFQLAGPGTSTNGKNAIY